MQNTAIVSLNSTCQHSFQASLQKYYDMSRTIMFQTWWLFALYFGHFFDRKIGRWRFYAKGWRQTLQDQFLSKKTSFWRLFFALLSILTSFGNLVLEKPELVAKSLAITFHSWSYWWYWPKFNYVKVTQEASFSLIFSTLVGFPAVNVVLLFLAKLSFEGAKSLGTFPVKLLVVKMNRLVPGLSKQVTEKQFCL